MKRFLTVGTNEIRKDLFVPISDVNAHSEVKPSGGLWLTEFDTNMPNYNSWMDFILYSKRNVLFYKNRGSNPFKQPCCVVVLKEEANIYKLDGIESYQFLLNHFSDGKGGFSYEILCNKYDGIYIDLRRLLYNMDFDTRRKFFDFDVDTLILFNCDCIDHYYSGVVDIVPFEPSDAWAIDYFDYLVKWDGEKKLVTDSDELRLNRDGSGIKR